MRRIHATISMIPGQRAAILDSHDTTGEWCGSSRIDSPLACYSIAPGAPSGPEQDRAAIYEIAYSNASVNAEAHGGTLDRFRWA